MSNDMNRDPVDFMDLTIALSDGKATNEPIISLLTPTKDFNLLDTISKINIGPSFNSFNSSCVQDLLEKFSPTFNQILTRHNRLHYKVELGRKIKKNYFIKFKGSKLHYIIPKKCQYQVHPAQIQEGIRRILYKLIPSEIMGDQRNRKKIMKSLQHFLKTSKNEYFNLQKLLKNLNFESTLWVQAINDNSQKRIFTAKFVKWLFQSFVAIIQDVLYVTHIQGEKVFIFKDDWGKQTGDQLQLMCKRSVLQLIGPVTEFPETKSRLCFIPKQDKLRPITIHKYEEEEEELLNKIHALLKYLYKRNYKKADEPFNETLIEILKKYNYDSDKIFAVSCDINDAYGSILQTKLFNMVQKMFQTLPTNLKFKHQIVRKAKKYQLITEDTNVLSYDPKKCEINDKQHLLQVLKKYIFETKVIYKKNVYNINRGVTQGLLISGILCSIYYTHMNIKYFAPFETKGYIFHYVDDYLYVTNQLNPAKEFLQKVEKGISEFNCKFKKSKLRHNLEEDLQSIKYLGWKFDFQPLKIEPQYNCTRYAIYLTSLDTKNFESKLKVLAALKLNKLILTKRINSSQQIFENIELICQRQAERCFAILSYLHNTGQGNANIDSIIKVNYYILRKIENLTEWNKDEKKRNSNILRYIMWRFFFDVFGRNEIFSTCRIRFKKLMKKYKKKGIVKLNI